jgi:hypothetical protein
MKGDGTPRSTASTIDFIDLGGGALPKANGLHSSETSALLRGLARPATAGPDTSKPRPTSERRGQRHPGNPQAPRRGEPLRSARQPVR